MDEMQANRQIIEIEESKSLKVVIWVPFLGFSFVLFMALKDVFYSIIPSFFSVAINFVFFMFIYRSILNSVVKNKDIIRIASVAGDYEININEIIEVSIFRGWGSRSMVMVVRVRGRMLPLFFWAAFHETSVGGIESTSVFMRKIMSNDR